MLPFLEYYRIRGLDAQTDIGPAEDHVEPDFSIHEIKPVPLAFEIIFVVRHDGALFRFRFDPRRESERLEVIEIGDRAVRLEEAFPVELAGSPHGTVDHRQVAARFVVFTPRDL